MTEAPIPQPIPAPTLGDLEVNLVEAYRNWSLATMTGNALDGLIRRCHAAERDRDAALNDATLFKNAAQTWSDRCVALSRGEEVYSLADVEKARREQMEADCAALKAFDWDKCQELILLPLIETHIRAAFESQERTKEGA